MSILENNRLNNYAGKLRILSTTPASGDLFSYHFLVPSRFYASPTRTRERGREVVRCHHNITYQVAKHDPKLSTFDEDPVGRQEKKSNLFEEQ